MGFRIRGPFWTVVMSVLLAATIIHLFASTGHQVEAAAIPVGDVESFLLDFDLSERSVAVEFGEQGNLTARDGELDKRLLAPASDEETYVRYRCKGEQLENYMLKDRDTILTESGIAQQGSWTMSTVRQDYVDASAGDPAVEMNTLLADLHLAGLNGVDEFRNKMRSEGLQNVVTYDNTVAPWKQYTWRQTKEYTVGTSRNRLDRRAPTNAFYQNIISIENKVVVIKAARSPLYMRTQANGGVAPAPETLPNVHRWSDITFLSFNDMTSMAPKDTGSGRAFKPPIWYMIEEVVGPADTFGVITNCLVKYGWSDRTRLPRWEQRFTFPIGSACYRAILGTQGSAGVAWHLIEHKFRFLDTVVGSITIWGTGTDSVEDATFGWEIPRLLLWTVRVQDDGLTWNAGVNLDKVRDRNVDFEVSNSWENIPWSMDFNFPLYPTYDDGSDDDSDDSMPDADA